MAKRKKKAKSKKKTAPKVATPHVTVVETAPDVVIVPSGTTPTGMATPGGGMIMQAPEQSELLSGPIQELIQQLGGLGKAGINASTTRHQNEWKYFSKNLGHLSMLDRTFFQEADSVLHALDRPSNKIAFTDKGGRSHLHSLSKLDILFWMAVVSYPVFQAWETWKLHTAFQATYYASPPPDWIEHALQGAYEACFWAKEQFEILTPDQNMVTERSGVYTQNPPPSELIPGITESGGGSNNTAGQIAAMIALGPVMGPLVSSLISQESSGSGTSYFSGAQRNITKTKRVQPTPDPYLSPQEGTQTATPQQTIAVADKTQAWREAQQENLP